MGWDDIVLDVSNKEKQVALEIGSNRVLSVRI